MLLQTRCQSIIHLAYCLFDTLSDICYKCGILVCQKCRTFLLIGEVSITNDMEMPENEPTGEIEPPPPSPEGYRISLHVFPQGFTVSGPLPIAETPKDNLIPNIRDAFREILAIHKDNPMSHDAQQQFDAGYGD